MHCFAVEETLSSGFVLDVHVIVCLAWLKKHRETWRIEIKDMWKTFRHDLTSKILRRL